MSNHTPGPWAQGTTLMTKQTCRWSAEEIAENNKRERRMVLAKFTPTDGGRTRFMVAHCAREEDAQFIAAAPDLLASLQLLLKQFEDAIRSEYEGTSMVTDLLAQADHARAAIAKATEVAT